MENMNREFVAQISISWYFFLAGASGGNWAAVIPQVEIARNIDHDTLGNILFAAAIGALCSVYVVSWCNRVIGSGRSCLIGSIAMAVFYPILGIQSNIFLFIFGVFLLGFILLFLDASMNSQAVMLEKVIEKPIIGYFHAIYAVGALFGALMGGIFLEYNFSLFHEFVIIGLVILPPNFFFSMFIYDYSEELIINADEITETGVSKLFGQHNESIETISTINSSDINSLSIHGAEDGDIEMLVRRHSSRNDSAYSLVKTQDDSRHDDDDEDDLTTATKSSLSPQPSSGLVDTSTFIKVSLLCFVSYFGEGSIGDWSGIYLTSYWSCSPFYATLGFVSCQLCIAIGRYLSDYMVIQFGRRNLLIAAGVIAAFGLFLAVIATLITSTKFTLFLAIAGFSLCGVGMSVVAPTAISMAGNIEGYSASDGVAYASAVGYLGVLIGPPFLGNLAIWLGSLHWSFLVDSMVLLTIAALGFSIPNHLDYVFPPQ